MRLVRIDIENFRLLQDVSVALSTDQDTTVFVGPNNSGQTSMAEALGLLLSAEKPAISDFSIASYGTFAAFEKIATAAEPEADAEAAPAELPKLPRIALKLHFDYSETPEDLRIAEAFWPAAGFVDTEIGCFMKPEVADATTEVFVGVQG